MSLKISSEVTDAFQALKMKRKYQWIIMKLSDDGKEVVVEVTETTEKTADSLCAKLPTDDSRFIVWDHKGKIVYILWSPDSASVKAKMTYAQTSQTL
ncbi:MAG: hypothetical protein KVP17_004078, partial [Porospora cf. gigantea B]|uniref:uncharacterized protein n=1 Tax=Porospora cf. gigantea B TaxID=2853592 RepID=UPI0035718BEE